MNHLNKKTYLRGRVTSPPSILIALFSCLFFLQCQSDNAFPQTLTVQDWAENFKQENPEVNDYLASDFCEISLAGFFNNSVSKNTEPLDSIFYFSEVFTDKYNSNDLIKLAEEIKEHLESYYLENDIKGNDVSFYKFADRLLILSVPLIERESNIYKRSPECDYTYSYPFQFETGCSESIMSATELTSRFDNTNSDGCYLNEAFPTPESGPKSWNKLFLYRTIPNEHSNKAIYTSDCGDAASCFARIENANYTAINPISCYLGENKAYCKPLEMPNAQSAYRLMIFDINLNICSPSIVMDDYQERLSDLAKAVRSNFLYGLNQDWTIHKALLRPTFDSENELKAHEAVIQYVKWGYNPNYGHGE